MKSKLFAILATLTLSLLSSCEALDDYFDLRSRIVGSWDIYSYVDEYGILSEVPYGVIYLDVNYDYTYYMYDKSYGYYGDYDLEGRTMYGISGNLTECFHFEDIEGDYAEIHYSNSVGDNLIYYATRD